MSFLGQIAAVLPLIVSTQAQPSNVEVYHEQPLRYAVVQRPGQPPVIVSGSAEILAREDLAGIWQVTAVEHQGQPRPDLAAGLRMVFTRGRLELVQHGRPTIIAAYNIGIKDYPRRMSWVVKPCGRIAMQKGVYWLEGETLMLCMGPVNSRRATEFLTQPGDGRTMYVLQRVSVQGY